MENTSVTVLPAVEEDAGRQVERVETVIGSLEQAADAFVVRSQADYEAGLGQVAEVKRILREAEADRTKITGPLNEALRRINARYKAPTDRLKGVQRALESKLGAWYAEQQRKAREAEARALAAQQAKLEKAAAKAEALGVAAPVPAPIAPRVAEPEKTVRVGGGAQATMRTVRRWRVAEFAAIPDEYKTTDDRKIGAVVRAGVTIPGIEIYEEHVTSVRGGF